eukprot:3825574-Rhodomonas_salina.1
MASGSVGEWTGKARGQTSPKRASGAVHKWAATTIHHNALPSFFLLHWISNREARMTRRNGSHGVVQNAQSNRTLNSRPVGRCICHSHGRTHCHSNHLSGGVNGSQARFEGAARLTPDRPRNPWPVDGKQHHDRYNTSHTPTLRSSLSETALPQEHPQTACRHAATTQAGPGCPFPTVPVSWQPVTTVLMPPCSTQRTWLLVSTYTEQRCPWSDRAIASSSAPNHSCPRTRIELRSFPGPAGPCFAERLAGRKARERLGSQLSAA